MGEMAFDDGTRRWSGTVKQGSLGVQIYHDPYGEGSYGEYRVFLNGVQVPIKVVSRLRDGGTTILHLENDVNVVFPHKIGDADRVPRYDGESLQ